MRSRASLADNPFAEALPAQQQALVRAYRQQAFAQYQNALGQPSAQLAQQQQALDQRLGFRPPVHAREPDAGPEKKARDLLFRLLSKEQQDEYRATGYFWLEFGKLRYRLGSWRVEVFDKSGEHLESWCVHSGEGPPEDTLIAQVLGLRHDCAGLRKVANVSTYRRQNPVARVLRKVFG